MAANNVHAWTEQRIERASRLWREGKSAKEIAEGMGGLTRSAVLGKLYRLGFRDTGRVQQRRCVKSEKPKPPRRSQPRKIHFKVQRMVEKPEAVTPLNVPFVLRLPHQCKAITDATRYEQKCCGHPIDITDPQMRGYCTYHRALYYVGKGKAR